MASDASRPTSSLSVLDLVSEAVRRADAAEARLRIAEIERDRAYRWQREADLAAERLRIEVADLRRRIREAKPHFVAIENIPAVKGGDGQRWARFGRKVLEGYRIVNGEVVAPDVSDQ